MRKQIVLLGALTFFTLGAAPQTVDDSKVPKGWHVVLYGQAKYRGEQKTYKASIPDVGQGWSKRVKSVSIGRGMWQLCDKPNYTGNCRILRSSIADLRAWGFPGPIRSVRAYVIRPKR